MAAGAGASLILWSEHERDCLAVERISISSKKIQTPKRLVFLSDLHDKEFGPENVRLIKAIDRAEPDAVLIGGDMMVSKGTPGISIAVSLVEKLAKKYPVYYGNGNHENRMVWERSVYGGLYEEYRDLSGKWYRPVGRGRGSQRHRFKEEALPKTFFRTPPAVKKGLPLYQFGKGR